MKGSSLSIIPSRPSPRPRQRLDVVRSKPSNTMYRSHTTGYRHKESEQRTAAINSLYIPYWSTVRLTHNYSPIFLHFGNRFARIVSRCKGRPRWQIYPNQSTVRVESYVRRAMIYLYSSSVTFIRPSRSISSACFTSSL